MVVPGYVVELAFQPLGLSPGRHVNIGQSAPTWKYTA
jgi:hypothetical protein